LPKTAERNPWTLRKLKEVSYSRCFAQPGREAGNSGLDFAALIQIPPGKGKTIEMFRRQEV
jgi:hypothetical protein